MAEVTTASTGNKPGGRRSKKLSTRVDLTPMVDLGFLLITFFIFTTTMSEPRTADLYMPSDKDVKTPTNVGNSAALTVLPLSGDKVFYYHGEMSEALKAGAFGITSYNVGKGIGQVIRDKQIAMDKMKPGFRKDLTLMIKPTELSTYQNVVDMLDEVAINTVPHYAIMEVTKEEKGMLQEKNGGL
jgi:hypothetical protein